MAVGVDIEEIKRFKNKSQKFLDRIYTKKEQEYCLSKTNPAGHLAVRFCAKEAVIKALTSLDVKRPNLNQIEISHEENKSPRVELLNKINDRLKIDISLSHDRTKAIAFVTVEKLA